MLIEKSVKKMTWTFRQKTRLVEETRVVTTASRAKEMKHELPSARGPTTKATFLSTGHKSSPCPTLMYNYAYRTK